MTIQDGINVESNGGYLGYNFGSNGVVSVAGSGSVWNCNSLLIGVNGSGTLSISGGGSVTSYSNAIGYAAGSQGVINVDGAGSILSSPSTFDFYVGENGSGTLSITNGGRVDSGATSGSLFSIGGNAGSTGVVNVSGVGSTWNQGGLTYVGLAGSGTLAISNGGSATTSDVYLTAGSNSTGMIVVSGAGSVWNNTGSLYISGDPDSIGGPPGGNGTLAITNGGSVSVAALTFVGTRGMIQFGVNGGTLTTQSLFASPSQLSGTGTIIAHGIVSDCNVVFDANHGLKPTFYLQQPGQMIAVNLDMTGAQTPNYVLGAGWNGAGSTTIQDGISVQSILGRIGHNSGSTGIVSVVGPGSAWTITDWLSVGTMAAERYRSPLAARSLTIIAPSPTMPARPARLSSTGPVPPGTAAAVL